MSFRVAGNLFRYVGLSAIVWLAAPTMGWSQTFGFPTAAGCGTSCGPACQTHHCPPAYKHCMEGPPHIHWRHGCPHPIADPCTLQHFGFFDTCWSPWPFPQNWGHCYTPPPAAYVQLHPPYYPGVGLPRTPGTLPPVTNQPPSTSPTPMPMPMGPYEELPLPRRGEQPR